MSKPNYRNRLLKLADKLDSVPDEQFSYLSWVGSDWEGKPDLSCGTTACALGWATTIPSFRKLGLRLHGAVPESPSGTDFDAATGIFGLAYSESIYLFKWEVRPPTTGLDRSPGAYATAKEVAAHLRRFADWKWPVEPQTPKVGETWKTTLVGEYEDVPIVIRKIENGMAYFDSLVNPGGSLDSIDLSSGVFIKRLKAAPKLFTYKHHKAHGVKNHKSLRKALELAEGLNDYEKSLLRQYV